MEAIGAIGAAASVLAIVEVVGRVSASTKSFMSDIKDVRKDMKQVRKDMSDLSTVLNMVAEDLDHDRSSLPGVTSHDHHLQNIVDIAHSCGTVVLEIETILCGCHCLLAWIMSKRGKVGKLLVRLETRKSLLDVALNCRTKVVVHDIKEDTTQIVGVLPDIQRGIALLPDIMRGMALLLLEKADNIERKAPGGQGSADGTGYFPGDFTLDHFPNGCRSDAPMVLDSMEYQQGQNLENIPPQQIPPQQVEAVGPVWPPPELTPSFPSAGNSFFL